MSSTLVSWWFIMSSKSKGGQKGTLLSHFQVLGNESLFAYVSVFPASSISSSISVSVFPGSTDFSAMICPISNSLNICNGNFCRTVAVRHSKTKAKICWKSFTTKNTRNVIISRLWNCITVYNCITLILFSQNKPSHAAMSIFHFYKNFLCIWLYSSKTNVV